MQYLDTEPKARSINMGTIERTLSLFTGAGLVSFMLARRASRNHLSLRNYLPLWVGAGYLIYRGATGRDLFYQAMDIHRAQTASFEGIQVQRTVTVKRPRDEIYLIWRNLRNLPKFMTHLERVQVDRSGNGKRSHWVAKAPLGNEIEWDAEIVEERENELIAWESLPGSSVESKGRVEFKEAPGGRGTEIHVSMQYKPPGGSLGAAFAKLFGEEPGQQVLEDLRHFKQIMETGEMATIEGQPSGRAEKAKISQRSPRQVDVVRLASEDSFPASDPPAWTSD